MFAAVIWQIGMFLHQLTILQEHRNCDFCRIVKKQNRVKTCYIVINLALISVSMKKETTLRSGTQQNTTI